MIPGNYFFRFLLERMILKDRIRTNSEWKKDKLSDGNRSGFCFEEVGVERIPRE